MATGALTAIDALLEHHLPALQAFVRRRAGRTIRERESDTDVVQSTCLEALGARSDFEYRGDAAFRHWLFTIALRRIIDRHRFYSRERADGDLGIPRELDSSSDIGQRRLPEPRAVDLSASQTAVRREEAVRVERAFERLDDRHREVLLHSRVSGLSRKEIAAQMHRNEEAVKKLLARAQARFVRLLDGPPDPRVLEIG